MYTAIIILAAFFILNLYIALRVLGYLHRIEEAMRQRMEASAPEKWEKNVRQSWEVKA